MKTFFNLFVTIILSILLTTTTFAGQWEQFGSLWYYRQDDGSLAIGSQQIDGNGYYFDQYGCMLTDVNISGYIFDNTGKNDQNYQIPLDFGYYAPDQSKYITSMYGQLPVSMFFNDNQLMIVDMSFDKNKLSTSEGNYIYDSITKTYCKNDIYINVLSKNSFTMTVIGANNIIEVPFIKVY